MAWRYVQRTGWLYGPDGHLLARGYAGKGIGKDNPALEDVADVGPLPAGEYLIGAPEDSEKLGPVALPLIPVEAIKRAGFFVHGDSLIHPGEASEGCIVLPAVVRQAMAQSKDKLLTVEHGADPAPEG